MITQEWSITLACILNTYHVETGVSQVQGQPKTHSDFKVRLSYMPRPYFKNSRTEFGSGVKHVQSTHRTWLDPQNCGKMFKNIARCICSLKYDLLPSVLGDLTLSYLSNWEGYPSDKGSSFYQSTNGSTDHEKKGSFFFFFLRLKSNFYGNPEKCDLLSWGGLAHCRHSKHWHFIWSNQDSETFVRHPRRGWDRR